MRLIAHPLNLAISGFETSTRALEDFSNITTRERGGFSESIKKSSHKATLWLCASVDHSAGVSAFDLRRCISERATSTRRLISLLALVPIASTFSSASREDSSGFSVAPSVWRLAISPRIAVTMNPALLSSGFFNVSMLSITSCGMRIEICFDLSLTVFFAIRVYLAIKCDSVYTKIKSQKALTCDSVKFNLNHTSILRCDSERQHPAVLPALTGRLTTNVSLDNEVAMFHRNTPHTGRAALTLKKITWRFLVLGEHAPVVVRITASSEQEARAAIPPCCIAIFAARIMRGGSANA